MSTWLYLQCLDHDPPLTSPDESGQHLYDLPQIHADIADRQRVVALVAKYGASDDGWDAASEYRRNTARFLADHPACRITVIDEYGQNHPPEKGNVDDPAQ